MKTSSDVKESLTTPSDTERINWLEKQGIVVAGGEWSRGACEDGATLWWDDAKGLREAIDISMGEHQEQ